MPLLPPFKVPGASAKAQSKDIALGSAHQAAEPLPPLAAALPLLPPFKVPGANAKARSKVLGASNTSLRGPGEDDLEEVLSSHAITPSPYNRNISLTGGPILRRKHFLNSAKWKKKILQLRKREGGLACLQGVRRPRRLPRGLPPQEHPILFKVIFFLVFSYHVLWVYGCGVELHTRIATAFATARA